MACNGRQKVSEMLLIVLWFSCVLLTEGKDSSTPVTTANCPSMLREGQAMWRQLTKHFQIYLNASNNNYLLPDCLAGRIYAEAGCISGTNCSSALGNVNYERNPSTKSIRAEIQQGDPISLKFDIERDSNGSSYLISISSVPTGKVNVCDVSGTTFFSTNDSMDISMDEDVLKPGNQSLIVELSSQDVECHLMWKLEISIRTHDCSKSKDSILCSNTGYCGDHKKSGTYTCSCCPGYVGKFCEERDACYRNPCQHGGFCVDIAEGLLGNTYQCLCPHGFRGRSCEGEVSLCDKRPCSNNGSCYGNQTHYTCLCPRGFTGTDCESNINECLSNPCIHGVCEDGIAGYKCYCLPGYGGDHCEFEYDECDSSPCINGGACEDLIAGYRCHCGPGYKGLRCQIKVDLCTPNPCPSPAQCVDRGNNYSCVCHPGHNSPGCTQHFDPCYPNPCQHDGECWPSLDSFFCSCQAGYTGDLCEEPIYASQPLPRTLEEPQENTYAESSSSSYHDVPVDHWHNVYIAGTMLTFAGTLVVLGAIVCHCRTHKTYLTLTRKLSRSCSEIKQQKIEEPGKFTMNLRGNDFERPLETTGFEASNLDVCENLDTPLIV